ncbi:MAG: 3-phosphoshikimate 1-carboxyvinyltransferase [Candidatus Margulisbacteria bacterium]|nr:3-phosphoshikimate 1-carboxyvinyltransferase [Candidatus Margulisiibacteriota bacterium]MBU1617442.1 3-phosphoshikimate 1-carboxyvinyltransferase [Candidatus Margulisiibacteriota bacterium]MBU1867019.1 3-phosphoshikimate 1-carboxyvinyltransferase [Candidatus Margulisiibacteriota bacterium]
MSQLLVQQAKAITGEITVPGDKSISHRAIMIGSIANGETKITGFLASADCLATIDCFRKLGIEIKKNKTEIRVKGKGLRGLVRPRERLYTGNSGTTIRLLAGILAGQSFTAEISGDESIGRRPMGRIAKPLRSMGADIQGRAMPGKEGELFPPLIINGGKLHGINYELPVASAQVKSAVLLAGLYAEGETTVREKNFSRDHTERMIEHFGGTIERGGLVTLKPTQELNAREVDVPGDISSAAFILAAATMVTGSELRIRNVGLNPTRTGILEIIHRMGGSVEVENEIIISGEPRGEIVARSARLHGIKIDGEIIPRIIDEIPIIAVLASQAEGVTEIRDARELRVKESDRIKTIATELRKFGVAVEELDDGLRISGPVKLKGGTIESSGDHRIAMAMAIAGLCATGRTVIEDTDCIETSFPGFAEMVRQFI